jgi:hypothetical protein
MFALVKLTGLSLTPHRVPELIYTIIRISLIYILMNKLNLLAVRKKIVFFVGEIKVCTDAALLCTKAALTAPLTSPKHLFRNCDNNQLRSQRGLKSALLQILHPIILTHQSQGEYIFKMPSVLVNSTIQACILTATSNFIAQFITAYKTNVQLEVSPPR